MIVLQYIQQAPTRMLLSWSNLPSSVYYYKSTGGKPGVKASSHTWKQDGDWVENKEDGTCKIFHTISLKFK